MTTTPMRILHILDHSLPLQSGYSFRTVSILREQHALGWKTLQLTTPRHGPTESPEELVDGWRFHRTPVPGKGFLSLPWLVYFAEMAATTRRLEELVLQFSPTILHAHSPALNAFPAFRVGRTRGIPVVYEVRSNWEDAAVDHGTTHEGSLKYRLSRALETRALRRADHLTVICEGLREEIASRGVPRDKITVIPNAVDTHAFRCGAEPDRELRGRLGLEGSVVLGFAGSFYGYEGLDLLVEAVRLLVVSRPDLKLLLVGGGFQEEALRAQVAAAGLARHVVFTGRVPHADVKRYYDLIDLLVYPRRSMRLTELVTPLKPLEAMAQGRVLLASDVGGHRELIRDGETGFLFKAGDPHELAGTLSRVLAERGAWPRVRKEARRFVEAERVWSRSVAGYVDVYSRLTNRPRLARKPQPSLAGKT
jgi:hypothetical protein